MAELVKTDEALELSLTGGGGSFQDNLVKIKEVPGARYDGSRKLWLAPAEPKTAERIIHSIQPTYDPAIMQWIKESRATDEAELVSPLPDDVTGLLVPWADKRMPYQPEKINDEPFIGLKPHQRALVGVVAGEGVRVVMADDMGLGKSATAISVLVESFMREHKDDILALSLQKKMGPILVVCPNSVKGVWKREIERWMGDLYPVEIIDSPKPEKRQAQLEGIITDEGIAIVNYEQLRVVKEKVKQKNGGTKMVKRMKQPLFETTEWYAVIADECHRAKNRKAAQTMGLYKVRGKHMLALSGTPLMNSPDDLWSILHWLYPKEYTSYWRFYENYVDYIEGHFGRDIVGVKNPDALRFELHGRLYRRTKGQVLKGLPEKQRIFVPVELDAKARKVYDEAEGGMWVELEKAIKEGDKEATKFVAAAAEKLIYQIPNGAARTIRLRQILSNLGLLGGDDHSNKMDAIIDAISDNSHKPHVVFAEFVQSCEILAERLRRSGLAVETYTGHTDQRKRSAMEDAFQAEDFSVIVGTIGAMREGLTLTAADTAHFLERAWVPAWNEQAEDRLHRIGQRDPVTIYVYQGIDTVDDGNVHITNALKSVITKTVLPQDYVKET